MLPYAAVCCRIPRSTSEIHDVTEFDHDRIVSIRQQSILGLVVYNDTEKLIFNHPVAPQDISRAVCVQNPTGVVVITGVHNT
jgi:hypothetical protein